MKLSILGPPGSGKSTQATQLCAILGLSHIYPGELLRCEAQSGSSLGKKINSYLETGSLVPTDIVMFLIERRLSEISNGYIFDGFPRTMEQAADMELLLHGRHEDIGAVVVLEVSEGEILRRLLVRSRPDDTPEIIKERIRIFHTETDPVLKFYEQRGRILAVSGEGSADQVTERILRALDKEQHTEYTF